MITLRVMVKNKNTFTMNWAVKNKTEHFLQGLSREELLSKLRGFLASVGSP